MVTAKLLGQGHCQTVRSGDTAALHVRDQSSGQEKGLEPGASPLASPPSSALREAQGPAPQTPSALQPRAKACLHLEALEAEAARKPPPPRHPGHSPAPPLALLAPLWGQRTFPRSICETDAATEIVSAVQLRRSRPREGKQLAQGCTAGHFKGQVYTLACLAPKAAPLPPLCAGSKTTREAVGSLSAGGWSVPCMRPSLGF